MKQGSLLSDDVGDRPPVIEEALPALRVLGQSAQTFIVAEGPEGLYMIDQHAAHERVLFDRLSSRSTGELESQPLLEPIVLELSSAQMEILEAEGSAFAGLGFTVEPFGDRACLVRGVPAAASGVPPAQLVLEVLDGLPTSSLMGNTWARGLAVVACKAAVKAGDTLSLEEMRSLVRQLEATERPRTCPHGRPTVLHLSTQRLEREFGRT